MPLLEGLDEFREHLGGRLTITLLRNLGEGIEVHEMDNAQISYSIGWLQDRLQTRCLDNSHTLSNDSTSGMETDTLAGLDQIK